MVTADYYLKLKTLGTCIKKCKAFMYYILSDELGKKARQIAFERNFPEEVEKQTVKVYRKIIKEIK